MMISRFLRVGTAILALSLASLYGHVKADDGLLECLTETNNLLLGNIELFVAEYNLNVYWASWCASETSACMMTNTVLGDGSSLKEVTMDYTSIFLDDVHLAYKDACRNAGGTYAMHRSMDKLLDTLMTILLKWHLM